VDTLGKFANVKIGTRSPARKKNALLTAYIAATDKQAEAVTALVKSKNDPEAFRSATTATE